MLNQIHNQLKEEEGYLKEVAEDLDSRVNLDPTVKEMVEALLDMSPLGAVLEQHLWHIDVSSRLFQILAFLDENWGDELDELLKDAKTELESKEKGTDDE